MSHHLFIVFLLCIGLSGARGAEDELLLSVEGNLIGPIGPLQEQIAGAQQASELIAAYHQLLESGVRAEVESLHEQMLKFIPGFEVAYTAADSAEIAHIMSEIDSRLADIQRIHSREYTQDVNELLTEAYQLVLPTFGDEH